MSLAKILHIQAVAVSMFDALQDTPSMTAKEEILAFYSCIHEEEKIGVPTEAPQEARLLNPCFGTVLVEHSERPRHCWGAVNQTHQLEVHSHKASSGGFSSQGLQMEKQSTYAVAHGVPGWRGRTYH